MDSINRPQNQMQQVLCYLFYYEKVTMKSVIIDSMFYKFTTVLSKLESEYGTIANRERKKFTNKFERESSYNVYSRSVSKEKLLEIFYKLQE